MSSSDDFFGSSAPSAAFPAIGTIVGGRIVRVGDPMQQRDFKTREPKFWDAEKREPMMQLPVDVQTDLRDPEVPGDTGVRTLYIKGDMKRAVKEALKKAAAQGAPKVGGTLEVAFVAEDAAAGTNGSPKKLYAARYTAPAAGDGFFGETSTGALAGAVQQAQAVQPVDPFAGQSVGASTGPAQGVNPFADEPPF